MRVIRLVLVSAALTAALAATSAFGVSPSPRLLELAKSDPALAEQPSFIDPEIGSDIDVATVDRIVIAANEFGIPEVSVEFAPATSGTLRTLAILVKPADKTAQVLPSAFDSLLFADVTGPASLRGYYREVSYGALDLTTSNMPSSVGWIGLPQNLSYYAGTDNGTGAWPNNAQKMVADAVAAADSAIDFSVYDNDHDGFVDNLIVIHAGRGAEFTRAAGDIWSHSWALNANAVTVDGVKVNGYTTEPEYWEAPGDMTTGVFAHEVGHVLGLPDLYDRTPAGTSDSEGIGNWSLMASGSWNGSGGLGGSAARPDAWSSLKLGWVVPTTITSAPSTTSVPTAGSASSGTVFRIYPNGASSGSEYFLVENRQKTGTDSYLPGSGMLVWHVDETQLAAQNDNEIRKLVDLEEADGLDNLDRETNRGDDGDPYPGRTNKTAFNGSTTPNSFTYAGVDSKVTITAIGTSQTTMTATMGIAFAYTLNYAAGAGGTIAGTASQTVTHGSSGTTVTAVPAIGYTFTGWSDGVLTAERREANVTANTSVTANFAINSYALDYAAGAGGTIAGTASQTVNHGSSGTTVTAVASTGYTFTGWSDGLLTAARRETNVTGPKSVTANFTINSYMLDYAAGPGGSLTGVVSQTVTHGSSGTTITAVASAGYTFTGWSDGVSTAARRETNVTGPKSMTANFTINSYALSFAAGTGGSLTGTVSQTVTHGSSGATVTAVASTGYTFTGWSDGVSTAARRETNVTGSKSVTANFTIHSYTLDYAAGPGGTITGTASQTVNHGSSGTTVTAVASAGYTFTGWSDGLLTAARRDANVTASKTVTANFTINSYELDYAASAGGTILGTTSQTVTHGSSGTTVTAVASTGYTFTGWSDGVSTAARRDTNVAANKIVTANFAFIPVADRVTGGSRYEVATNLARKGWDPGDTKTWSDVRHIIIANGEPGKEADPLTAAALAGIYDAPVLLVQAASIPAVTRTVITEISAKRKAEGTTLEVHLIGGVNSVPDARWTEISKIAGVSGTKDRIAGRDRYAVSASIAERVILKAAEQDKAITGVILIAADNPAAFYDALAASPVAYARTMPMLAVQKTKVPPSVASVLATTTLVGQKRYAASSSAYIASALFSNDVTMTTSSDRYTAAADIAEFAVTQPGITSAHTGLTAKLSDALTGGTYLGKMRGVLLFTDSSSKIQSASTTFIQAQKSSIAHGWIIGGPVSVPETQLTEFKNLLK